MRIVVGIVGVLAMALGGLWLLQGLSLVHIAPIACIADCAEIEGRSIPWAVVGLVTAAAGAWGAVYGFVRR